MSHSELPPSSADKWVHCYGWRRLNANLPNTSSPAAEEGIEAHRWLADELTGEVELINCPDEEMFDHLIGVIEWINQQPGERWVEHRVDYGKGIGFVDLTGTSDLILVSPEELVVADLKYGRGVVEAKDNFQLLCYLLGAIQEFGPRPSYRLCILQPRAWHEGGPYRSWTITPEVLEVFADQISRAIKGSYDPRAEATAGDWCQHYCKAFGSCKAAAAKSLDLFRSTPI